MILRPHYSSNLELCDFFLFPTGKRDLKGRRFEALKAALRAAETAFKCLTQIRWQPPFQFSCTNTKKISFTESCHCKIMHNHNLMDRQADM